MPDAKTAEALADRYVAVWNEPDAEVRRKEVGDLWTENGVNLLDPPEEIVRRAEDLGITATLEARGHGELMSRVTRAYDEFVAPGQHVFRRDGAVAVVRDMVKVRWVMVPAGGGDALAGGTDLLLVAPDGRIAANYQFIDD
ncbi:hypothetical protein E1218_34840 [Kribbella turkmenica]|uniref:Nuclear transport factor 2 family protein n=1 Tax=Kribbella turkmenica TaxID=2530375 RepID=A0A4R4W3N6_9ACTN|nr:hypothetical protein [Kribbella turkmenica]TDD13199.1 hypothetical protein E1218_34840 [Kribbella turkmenica]